jgi:hypothetical protein
MWHQALDRRHVALVTQDVSGTRGVAGLPHWQHGWLHVGNALSLQPTGLQSPGCCNDVMQFTGSVLLSTLLPAADIPAQLNAQYVQLAPGESCSTPVLLYRGRAGVMQRLQALIGGPDRN